MARHRRKFKRGLGNNTYRKLFLISCEGAITEPEYFEILSRLQPTVAINCLYEKGKSAPKYVLEKMKKKKISLKEGDETWLVIDKDRWNDAQINELVQWVNEAQNIFRGLALSNPKFELWLLLHFENADNVVTSRDCSNHLLQYLPGYNKSIDAGKFNLDMVNNAISRAKVIDNPPCADWPRNTGTTVYRLVQNIINSDNNNSN